MGTCQSCNGLGTVTCCGGGIVMTHSYTPCPHCNGTGRRICTACNGTGKHPTPSLYSKEGDQ